MVTWWKKTEKYGEFTFSYYHNIENPPWNEKYGFYQQAVGKSWRVHLG
jgi:hypothetical protein